MNVDKLSIMLCLAFQESDGPFRIIIKTINSETKQQEIPKKNLSKEEIKNISDDPAVISIDIVQIIDDRRTKERWTKNRRKYIRNWLKTS